METEPPLPPEPTENPIKNPPRISEFPKPDFTEIVQDHQPLFKSALQAKKRLLAFSSKPASLPSSPKKVKPNEEKSEEAATSPRKTPKKGMQERPKTLIEEIEELKKEELKKEELKKEELAYYKNASHRSKSRSPDKGRFKKVGKKSRNYRRRSASAEKQRPSSKKAKKYPKNWKEFHEIDADFDINKVFEVLPPTGNNELLRQLFFESPSLPIVPFKVKSADREDKTVPFQYIRYTKSKPSVAYSVNFVIIKDVCLTKKMVLDALPKNVVANIEHLYSNSIALNEVSNSKKKSTSWYPKMWKDSNLECKILESSVGLSFLQNYTGDEEDNDAIEAEKNIKNEQIREASKEEEENINEKKEVKKQVEIEEEKTENNTQEKEKKKKKKKKRKNEKTENEDEKEKNANSEEVEILKKRKRKKEKSKKKKKKQGKDKKRVKSKEKKRKKKQNDENVEEKMKKKEREEDKEEKSSKRRHSESGKETKKNDENCKSEEKRKSEERRKSAENCKIEERPKIEEKSEPKIKKTKSEKRKSEEKSSEHKEKKVKQEKRKSEEKPVVKAVHPLKAKLEKAKKEWSRVKHEKESRKVNKIEETKRKEENKKEKEGSKRKKSRWSDSQVKVEDTEEMLKKEIKKIEEDMVREGTPDTDDYHSHWESDDDIPPLPAAPRRSLKNNRSWESDEELFERNQSRNMKTEESFEDLQIPLNIINFPPRREKISVIDELKLLEEERRSLSEERKKLELEKERIMRMQEETKFEITTKKDRMRSSTPEQPIKVKKEKPENDFSIDSLNNSILSAVSSAESNFPIGALENEYEEFIKAVSTDSSVSSKKKVERSSSSSSSSSSSDSDDHKKKKRKKRKKKKKRRGEGLLVGKGNDIFNKFDIPVPSDLPEMVPTPVPVPSPILSLDNILPITAPKILIPLPDLPKEEINENVNPMPFVFSSIVLPSKKHLVDNSNLKLDDTEEENEEEFANKEETKPDVVENEQKKEEQEEEMKSPEKKPVAEEKVEAPIEIPLPPPQSTEAPPKPKKETTPATRNSRSDSPTRRKRRSHDRRSPIKRRDSEIAPPSRRRPSPRRRSPPRRRRTPSPRRRSPLPPPRRRRRSPTVSPPRRRKRSLTPSSQHAVPPPRRRASPLNSPLDGFKKSVADSTISDDMLPQPVAEEYRESPPSVFNKVLSKNRSESPQPSPRRISLDDRINQVLGLEKNDAPPPPPAAKPPETYNYNYTNYMQQYPQYGQFGPKNDFMTPPPFGMMYTQPPPPIVKPVATPTKVVQVGNILQVVPTEELPPPMTENKVIERSQKIVQVGNMLQIVPAVIPAKPVTAVEPSPVVAPVPPPVEKPSAESQMKQKAAERKAEREKRRQEREKRRKEKEKKRKEREKKKQLKLKMKKENMIKREIQIEAEALANDDLPEEAESSEAPIQWPPVPVIISATPTGKGILSQGGNKQRKSVQFADGVRPGEGTSPSGGEELSSPPPQPRKLPKEKRYYKVNIPKKSKKKKVRVKVVKKAPAVEEDDDDDDNLPPPSPPPGSPPPHIFPSRVKTHTINNVHQFVGNIVPGAPFPFRPPMPVMMNRHQGPPVFMQGAFPQDVNNLAHQYQGVSSHH